MRQFLLILFIFPFVQILPITAQSDEPVFVKKNGYCIMYGECAVNTKTHKNLNCIYNGTAKPLEDPEALDLLLELCPFLHKGNATSYTCCDINQLHTIKSNLQVPYQAFSRCPTCMSNFVATFCEMTCSPNQSMYVKPVATAKGDKGDYRSLKNQTYLTELQYNMTETFANSMYDSCKDVTNPATNAPAIKILCGPYASDCTAQKWLTYMNSLSNGYAPFQIDIVFTKTSDFSMNYKTTPCNESVTPGGSGCSCNDCPASCSGPPPKPPVPAPEWLILNNDPYYVIMFAVFIGVTFIYLILVTLCYIGKSKSTNEMPLLNDDFCGGTGAADDLGVQSINNSRFPGEKLSTITKIGTKMDNYMQKIFCRWGIFCASHPLLVIICGIVIVGVCSLGLVKMQITTDPVELWSSPESTARKQKDYYDSHFGPFYRTEQLIITAPWSNGSEYKVHTTSTDPKDQKYQHFGPILQKGVLLEILALQLEVEAITAFYPEENRTIGLEDICLKPLAPYNKNCTIMSPLNYFQNDLDTINYAIKDAFGPVADFHDHLMSCTSGPTAIDDATPLHLSCLGTYGGPVFPWVALGGYDAENYLNATAAVITFSVNNFYNNSRELGKALAWEKEFIKFMKSFTTKNESNLTVAFSSERSIEDEINRESGADISTIAASYLIMFAYVAIALGRFSSCNLGRIMIEFKLTVGLSGVLIVLCSVLVSLGLFSYAGIPMTLIIVEVVPFLVLAVGVDNIFILVQHYQRDERDPKESSEQQIGRLLGEVAPSMFMSSMSESLAFFLGGLSTMPAVRTFSLYAGLAVLVDFILQMTCFVAVLSLDVRRQNVKRYDCCCCIQDHKSPEGESDGLLHKLMRDIVAKLVLSDYFRPLAMIFFFGVACFSGAVLHKVDIGLDQSLSMPSDSYVLDYFSGINNYLSVGAPVYFVVPDGYDYKNGTFANKICGGNGCNEDSMIQKISYASQMPNYSTIAYEASSWIDDYYAWLKPQSSCCRYYDNADPAEFCNATIKPEVANCSSCRKIAYAAQNPRPNATEFMDFLPWFLQDNPETECAKGGHAAYGSAVNVVNKQTCDVNKTCENATDVGATYFMTYHTVAKTSSDFISCLKHANDLSANITSKLNGTVEVFPYSVFYVYYEQYLTIVHDTIFNLSISIFVIFLIVFTIMGFDILSALVVVLTISLIILNMFGVMYLWDIPLNAVSLVNLVMAVGISVEFCSHVTRAFALSQRRTRMLRAKEALSEMGSSVLSGITLTKFVGIAILAFSKSQIFRIFYFRMYLAIVLLGATHGLILLPILLSYIGPGRRPRSLDHTRLVEEESLVHENPESSNNRREHRVTVS